MPQFPSTSSASGIWTLKKQKRAQQGSNWPPLVLPDPQFNYVTVLLPGNGTNGAQNNTFLDSSTNNFTITRNGNTTQGTFSPYGSNWSNYFDGSGDWLQTASNSVFTLATGNFTVEAWVFLQQNNSSTYQGIVSSAGVSPNTGFTLSTDLGRAAIGVGNASVADLVTSSSVLPINTWVHIAGVRVGNTLTLYVNGVSQGSVTTTRSITTSEVAVGAYYLGNSPTYPFTGYVSNVRVINSAIYTSNFTPSVAPLTAVAGTILLTCQSNRFIDNSTNNITINRNGDVRVQRFSPFSPTASYTAATIGGSGYFDGASDTLSIASNAAFGFGTGNFTVELFVYCSFNGNIQEFIDARATGTAIPWVLGITGTGVARTYDGGTVRTGGQLVANAWNHVAWVRASNVNTVYVNGVFGHTWTASQDFGSSKPILIGDNVGTGEPFTGYITDLRIVKGTAVYTTAFTPPSAPLTAITNTSLLCSFTNAGVIDNAMMGDLETRGTAQISTAQSKFGGGSLAFDGTSGNMVTGPSVIMPQYDLPGDFTIEAWMYINSFASLAASPTIVNKMVGNLGEQSYRFAMRSNEFVFTYSLDGINVTQITKSITNNTGTWYHVALTRSGNNLRFFRNGVQVGTTETISGSIFSNGPQPFSVGSWNSGASGITNGYIDDFRLTKGYARYTANFTPPAAPFPPL